MLTHVRTNHIGVCIDARVYIVAHTHITYTCVHIHTCICVCVHIHTLTHVHTHMLTHAYEHAHVQPWARCSVLQVSIYRGCGLGADKLLVFSPLAVVPDELVDGKAGDSEAGHTSNDDHHSIHPVRV